mmetsp:Transcript_63442/g.129241  ORF Transcript_63442/g.129241 Transcript_63442/m.129241 type:complete len:221 (-) Transcript_63442:2123-2785(-)
MTVSWATSVGNSHLDRNTPGCSASPRGCTTPGLPLLHSSALCMPCRDRSISSGSTAESTPGRPSRYRGRPLPLGWAPPMPAASRRISAASALGPPESSQWWWWLLWQWCYWRRCRSSGEPPTRSSPMAMRYRRMRYRRSAAKKKRPRPPAQHPLPRARRTTRRPTLCRCLCSLCPSWTSPLQFAPPVGRQPSKHQPSASIANGWTAFGRQVSTRCALRPR